MRRTMYSRRSILLGSAQLGVAGLLGARMAWISIAENEQWQLLSESNRVQLSLIPPRRGWIIDREGQPIAMNRSDFRVDVIPDRLNDREPVLAALTELLDLPAEELERINEELDTVPGAQPVQVAAGLEWEKFAAVNVRLPDLPGVAPIQGFARHYPAGAAVGHLVGYVGAPTREQYLEEDEDPLLLFPGFKVGKDGLEKTFEETLRGEPGARRAEVTARGQLVRELDTRPDRPGETLQLTVDAGLQEYVGRRLGNESGAAVVMNCQTGHVLAMASMPCFDPNSFSDGISHPEYNMLSEDERVPLRNKSLLGMYPPGSTFKPVTALAALEAGVDPEEVVYCGGGYRLGNRRFGCLGVHGPVNLHRAIARSCNTYFYTMSRRIGIPIIAETARALGLGQDYPIPVANQNYGTVPDDEWVVRRHNREWTDADTLNTSIGQGYLLTTPLQLAVMSARIASGRAVVPKLVDPSGNPAPQISGISRENLELVRAGMDEVVNGAGTAPRARLPLEDVRLAGKTGTAQVVNLSAGRGGRGVPWRFRDHGLFVSFAPADNPLYACAVVVEHGMSGGRAASPVARDAITYLYDRERAMEDLERLEAGWGGDTFARMAQQEAEYRRDQGLPPREGLPIVPPRADDDEEQAP
ncbi:penicillin-binding protein 2 [Parasphingopyxis sp. CP4]|uniref:penicillin-binding protein 2 n=1 Tax=Parasphingopyxis sp. CP4 TaxID=2724527 RepID=UPI0015A311E7|nr:penicillin-binding protein 2 [Parasphingopyxis sp. CP4]QLC21243.1 penicillin-binding protein 2 [Parasphingopyxis sp. CP4]